MAAITRPAFLEDLIGNAQEFVRRTQAHISSDEVYEKEGFILRDNIRSLGIKLIIARWKTPIERKIETTDTIRKKDGTFKINVSTETEIILRSRFQKTQSSVEFECKADAVNYEFAREIRNIEETVQKAKRSWGILFAVEARLSNVPNSSLYWERRISHLDPEDTGLTSETIFKALEEVAQFKSKTQEPEEETADCRDA